MPPEPNGELPIDFSNPLLEAIYSEVEDALFGNLAKAPPDEDPVSKRANRFQAEDAFVRTISQAFRDGFAAPRAQAIWQEVVSGCWGLGSTKGQVIDSLSVGEDMMDNGLIYGKLSFPTLNWMLCFGAPPPNWLPDRTTYRLPMFRNGYIEAMVKARKSLPKSELPDPPAHSSRRLKLYSGDSILLPGDYELQCEIFRRYNYWEKARWDGTVAEQHEQAARIVAKVYPREQKTEWAVPRSVPEINRSDVTSCIIAIQNSPQEAFDHLTALQDNWEKAAIVVGWMMEVLEWRQ